MFKLWLLHNIGNGNTHRYSFQGGRPLNLGALVDEEPGDEETFLAEEEMA